MKFFRLLLETIKLFIIYYLNFLKFVGIKLYFTIKNYLNFSFKFFNIKSFNALKIKFLRIFQILKSLTFSELKNYFLIQFLIFKNHINILNLKKFIKVKILIIEKFQKQYFTTPITSFIGLKKNELKSNKSYNKFKIFFILLTCVIKFYILNSLTLLKLLQMILLYLRFYSIYFKYYFISQLYYNYNNLQFYSNSNYRVIRFVYTLIIEMTELVGFLFHFNLLYYWSLYYFKRTQFLFKLIFKKLWLIISFLIFYIYMVFNIVFNYNVFIKTPFDSNLSTYKNEETRFLWLILPIFKSVQFFIRPFLRYLNSFTVMRLNFRVLNQLFYMIVTQEILNFIFIFVRIFKWCFYKFYNSGVYLLIFWNKFFYYSHLVLLIECVCWIYRCIVDLFINIYINIFFVFKKYFYISFFFY